jgi:uncharacterized protein
MVEPRHIGIDYGSKLAGTTAVAIVQDNLLKIDQSSSGQDADKWLVQLINDTKPASVFIDAPLSLPKIYSSGVFTSASEYFYRLCDKELHAMSPMFIGGLTARAIRLKTLLSEKGIAVLETYPSGLAKIIFPDLTGYKKGSASLQLYTEALQNLLPINLADKPSNWHQFDCILAWLSGYRHLNQKANLYGDAREGIIIV